MTSVRSRDSPGPQPCFHVNVSIGERKWMQKISAVEAELPLTKMSLGLFSPFLFLQVFHVASAAE